MGAMNFLNDDRDDLHGPRLAGLFYLVGGALLFWFDYSQHDIRARTWVPRLALIAGWWISFCDKRPAHSIVELLRSPRHAVGAAIAVIGLALGFYWPFG
jgi:hypothetical protein